MADPYFVPVANPDDPPSFDAVPVEHHPFAPAEPMADLPERTKSYLDAAKQFARNARSNGLPGIYDALNGAGARLPDWPQPSLGLPPPDPTPPSIAAAIEHQRRWGMPPATEQISGIITNTAKGFVAPLLDIAQKAHTAWTGEGGNAPPSEPLSDDPAEWDKYYNDLKRYHGWTFLDVLGITGARAPFAKPGTVGAFGGMVPVEGLYSKLGRTVEAATQSKAPAEQWLGTLRNAGVKPDEMQWTGMEDWLKSQNGPVSKSAVQDYVLGHQVEVYEVMKGQPTPGRAAIEHPDPWVREHLDDENFVPNWIEAHRGQYPRQAGETPPLYESRLEDLAHAALQESSDPRYHAREPGTVPTRWETYQLPGGENYRELLLALPRRTPDVPIARAEARPATDGNGWILWDREHSRPLITDITEADARWAAAAMSRIEAERRLNFHSSHFDEPNILAHVRFNERTVDGKKTLFIEEVQSDWHQEGREQGYQAEPGAGKGVPDAPFKTTWPELAMKRMIRYAAENGYDKIAWTTGETQTARYPHLSTQVAKLKYGRNGSLTAYDPDGGIVLQRTATPDDLPDLIGKDAAEKLLSQKVGRNRSRMLEGLDLKIGGEGMKGFYNQILPATVNKLVKKYGARVDSGEIESALAVKLRDRGYDPENVDLQTIRRDNGGRRPRWLTAAEADAIKQGGHLESASPMRERVHSLDLTPTLKDTALKHGFPLFAIGGGLLAVPIDYDPFEKQ